MNTQRELIERMFMGITSGALVVGLLYYLLLPIVLRFSLPPYVGFLLLCTTYLIAVTLCAVLAVKRVQPFKWLEEKLRRGC